MSSMSGGTESGFARVTSHGTTYLLRVPDADTDYIQGKVREEGTPYEAELLSDMAVLLTPDDLVLDIGANVGNHTMFLACVVGCRVHAFEPDQHLADAISESAVANGVEQLVELHTLALGAEPTHGILVHDDLGNLGGGRVVAADQEREGAAGASVRVVPLDEVVLPSRVAMMKIDVEGMELSVLEGARRLVTHDRPMVYVECLTVEAFDAVEEFMEAHGYVWLGVFNASPTHLFVHQEALVSTPNLRQRMGAVARADYSLRSLLATTRGSLDEASRRYRELARQLAEEQHEHAHDVDRRTGLSARLDETKELVERLAERVNALTIVVNDTGPEPGGRSGREAESDCARDTEVARLQSRCELLEQRERELVEQLARADERVSALEARHARVRRDLRVVREFIEEQRTTTERLRVDAERAKSALTQHANERDAAVAQLKALRKSATYRVGKAFRDAQRSPKAAMRIVPELLKARRTSSGEGTK